MESQTKTGKKFEVISKIVTYFSRFSRWSFEKSPKSCILLRIRELPVPAPIGPKATRELYLGNDIYPYRNIFIGKYFIDDRWAISIDNFTSLYWPVSSEIIKNNWLIYSTTGHQYKKKTVVFVRKRNAQLIKWTYFSRGNDAYKFS